ncbi:16S rRNA (adenine(1518)-N(6)/adenine(1519)-N(6))-dimethyltransferase RsmA [Candidatus Albibeggiatoa sp. nov. BB20]|uniref:16S rRNA (adenine(1518)-N(6)/adenine(1519)-N(6))- dimethyltransferase RsmA n=1 Tax=Candidatus Albibeggiatoa sp. nov. BB20 TaxID=3162723 RepID=UPI003365A08A
MMNEHRPRKRFGQNFLHDSQVIQQIIAAIAPRDHDFLVEIGPGQGALTQPLLTQIKRLVAIEFDRDLVQYLQDQNWGELTIYQADVLKFDFATLNQPTLRIVGNLPYNISTPLLFHVLNYAEMVQDMVFMLQKEVVDRIVAKPSCSDYGRLSVMLQYHCHAEKLFNVSPMAFNPPPKVDSSIVHLIPHAIPPVQLNDKALFEKLVAQAFTQRRKTLRNNLKPLLSSEQIEQVGINPQVRAETLSLEEFAALSNLLVD